MENLIFKLPVFEGPLDLLEHLIKKNKLDICTVSLIEITDQYIEYIHQMDDMDLDVSTDFLIVASNLLYIKSKALLPKHEDEKDDRQVVKQIIDDQRWHAICQWNSLSQERYFRGFAE